MSDCGCKDDTNKTITITGADTTPELNASYEPAEAAHPYNVAPVSHNCGCGKKECLGDCRTRYDRDGKPYKKATCKACRQTNCCCPKQVTPDHHPVCDKPKCSPKPCGTMQHLQPIVYNKFSPYIKSSGRVLMPSEDGTNLIQFPDIDTLEAGTVLYNESIGYITIVSWDETNHLATFRNAAEYSEQQVLQSGEWIPDCTNWVVTAPSTNAVESSTDDSACYLANDFVVPELDDCVNAVFTSTDCFGAGDSVRIDGVALKVSDVVSSYIAELCNVESENDALKEIVAKDCDELLHKVVVIGEESPCDNPLTTLTSILGLENDTTCKKGIVVSTSERSILGGNATGGWIVKDDCCDEVQSAFDGCVTLNPALENQEYPITLAAPSGFEVGTVGHFSCDEADPQRQFKIKTLTGANAVLEPVFDVTAVEAISDDCASCTFVSEGCCIAAFDINDEEDDDGHICSGVGDGFALTQLEKQGNTLVARSVPDHKSVRIRGTGSSGNWNLTAAGDQEEATVEQEIVNDTCREMNVFVTPTFTAQGIASTAGQDLLVRIAFDSGDGSFGSNSESYHYVSTDSPNAYARATIPFTTVIAPHTTATIRVRGTVVKQNAAGNYNSTGAHLSGSMRGIAMTGDVV